MGKDPVGLYKTETGTGPEPTAETQRESTCVVRGFQEEDNIDSIGFAAIDLIVEKTVDLSFQQHNSQIFIALP